MQTRPAINLAPYGTFNGGSKFITYSSPQGKQILTDRHNALDVGYQHRQRAGAYGAEQAALEQQNTATREQREKALADLDRGYADPSRMAGMEKLYSTGLQSQLAGLQQNFQHQSQKSGLAMARRGRLGSSTDAEHQARLQAGLQGDVMNAEQNAYGQLNSLRTADTNQHEALRRAILAGDPQAAASYQAQAQGYGDQTSQLLQRQQEQGQADQRSQQQQREQYDLYGNILNSGATGVRNWYGNYP